MGSKNRRKRNIPITIMGVLLCMTLATTWFVDGIFARFIVTDSASDSARVAAFVFNVSDSTHNNESTHLITLAGITKPGDSETYAFVVKNSSGSAVSEVSEYYAIRVSLSGSIPLTATLTKEGVDVFTVNTSSGAGANATSGTFTPGNAVANQDSYTLTVTWPTAADSNLDADFASGGGIATLALTVTGVQAD